jgi:hypothetical protein
MKESQSHFSRICPEWTPQSSGEIGNLCCQIYESLRQLPEKHGIIIPNIIPSTEDPWVYPSDSDVSKVSPVFKPLEFVYPRIKDFEIPEKFKPVLTIYAEKSNHGDKTYLPVYEHDVYLMLYNHIPIQPSEDIYGFSSVAEEYGRWGSDVWNKWRDSKIDESDYKFLGWDVKITREDNKGQKNKIDLYFSTKHDLFKASNVKHDPEQNSGHSLRSTEVSFRGRKLYRLWSEVPNGTIFPDPRGPKESIWPKWIKGIGNLGFNTDFPATQDDWGKYIAKVRNGERVVSGKTRKFVHQTEKQANNNLATSREYIFNSTPQVFYFRRTLQDPGFISMVGYRARSKYGEFLPKNSQSTRILNAEETKTSLLNELEAFLDLTNNEAK